MPLEESTEEPLLIADDYDRASTLKRLANYIIDIIVFYIFLFILAIVVGIFAPTLLDQFIANDNGYALLDRIITIFIYAIFMSLVESILNGKSVGKYITKTRAVNLDGSKISASTAFARGLSRAVPFCAFSAFGHPCNPWQDRWTNTKVINE